MTDPCPLDEVLLDLVGLIPPGSLATYGDMAALADELGFPCTARRAARTLRRFGSGVPWWRVVQSSGTVAQSVLAQATPLLSAEGITVVGRRVPLGQRRWRPTPDDLMPVASGRPGGGDSEPNSGSPGTRNATAM
mgnify:FL=1